jgi:hypothetical protein
MKNQMPVLDNESNPWPGLHLSTFQPLLPFFPDRLASLFVSMLGGYADTAIIVGKL